MINDSGLDILSLSSSCKDEVDEINKQKPVVLVSTQWNDSVRHKKNSTLYSFFYTHVLKYLCLYYIFSILLKSNKNFRHARLYEYSNFGQYTQVTEIIGYYENCFCCHFLRTLIVKYTEYT